MPERTPDGQVGGNLPCDEQNLEQELPLPLVWPRPNVSSVRVRDWWHGGTYSLSMGERGSAEPVGRPLRVVDLFAGAGGISEGFRQAGIIPIVGADIDPDACATFRHNFPEADVLCGDIRQPDLRTALLEIASTADILTGGPPCQAFSQMRNHSRIIDDPRNSLYREFVAIVSCIAPKAFVMENVPGMAQMGVVEQVEEDLACGGMYSVRASVVDAADFGVPQTRKRIVFLGIHRDVGLEPPELIGTGASTVISLFRPAGRGKPRYDVTVRGCGKESDLVDRLHDPWDDGVVSAEQAIGDLGRLRPGTSRLDDQPSTILGQPRSAYQKVLRDDTCGLIANVGVPRINRDTVLRLRSIPQGGNYLDLPEKLSGRYLTGERWGHDNGTGLLSRKHFYAYRRLHPAIWSWTLNTKADSVYHWLGERALSVREFARLQSFPDSFVVTTDARRGALPGRIDGGAGHSRYRQVGNAVPPRLARAIAAAMKEALG